MAFISQGFLEMADDSYDDSDPPVIYDYIPPQGKGAEPLPPTLARQRELSIW